MRIQVNKEEFVRLCFKCFNSNCYSCILQSFCDKCAKDEGEMYTEKLAQLCVITHEGEADS